ncbi:MAG: GPP34 family phosphoprotein [Micrococcaceae bacterium]
MAYTLSEKYFMLAIPKKGKFGTFKSEKKLLLVAAGLSQLLIEKTIKLEKKTFEVVGPLQEDSTEIKPIFDVLEKKPLKIWKIVRKFMVGVRARRQFGALLTSVGTSLKNKNALEENPTEKLFIPKKSEIDPIVAKLRDELLGDEELSEENVALAFLLHEANKLKEYFSEDEVKTIDDKLENIENTEANQPVKDMVKSLKVMHAIILGLMATTHV